MFNWCCQQQLQANEELFMYQYQGFTKKRTVITRGKLNQHINNRQEHFQIYAKSKYDQILEDCIKRQRMFVDSQFQIDLKELQKISYRKLGLNRIKNLAAGSIFIPQNHKFILSLKKHDSYFLASLKALTSSNQNILRILDGVNTINQYGIYKLNILVNGKPKQYIIDDFIPVFDDNSKRLLFSNIHDGLLWVILVQKAYAKLFGGYHQILQGNCHEIFNIFALAPSLLHEIPLNLTQQNQQNIWNIIAQAIKYKFPITCTSRDSKTCTGIISHKVYPIVDCSIQLKKSQRIIKISNITNQLQFFEHACLQYQNKGEFIKVQLNEFIRNFQIIDVAHIRNNYNSHFYSFKAHPEDLYFYKFQILQEIDFYLTLQKIDSKKGRIRMIVGRVLQNQNYMYQFVAGKMQQNFSDLTLHLKNLPKGKYLLLCQSTVKGQCCLRVYCQTPLILQQHKQGYKFLQHMFYGLSLKAKSQWQLLGQNKNDWIYTKQLLQKLALGFMIICLSKFSQYKCGIQFNNQLSVKYRLINKKQKIFIKQLGMGDIQILIFELIDRNMEVCQFPPDNLILKKRV